MLDLDRVLDFSEALAQKAGSFLVENQKRVRIKDYKEGQDIVTNIDLEVEEIIIQAIEKKYPQDNIFSEERGSIDKKGKLTWYIDPLDGTKEYYRQIPDYNLSWCLFSEKKPVFGLVYLPYSNQLFVGLEKRGAFLNGKKIKVNSKNKLKDFYLHVHAPTVGKMTNQDLKKNFQKLEKLTKSVFKVRYSHRQANSFCFLALGSIDAYLDFTFPTKSLEDTMPGFFIAKTAGAKITDLKGRELTVTPPGQLYIASNGQIHKQLQSIIHS